MCRHARAPGNATPGGLGRCAARGAAGAHAAGSRCAPGAARTDSMHAYFWERVVTSSDEEHGPLADHDAVVGLELAEEVPDRGGGSGGAMGHAEPFLDVFVG